MHTGRMSNGSEPTIGKGLCCLDTSGRGCVGVLLAGWTSLKQLSIDTVSPTHFLLPHPPM